MNQIPKLKVIVLIFAMVFLSLDVIAMNLLETYEKAIQSNPAIKRDLKKLKVKRLELSKVRSKLYPQVNASGSLALHKQDGQGNPVITDTDVGVEDLEKQFRVLTLQVMQPLFHWDQLARITKIEKNIDQAEVEYQLQQQLLIMRVAERYFDVLFAQEQLNSARSVVDTISEQLTHAQKQYHVGLIAVTDAQESQAAYDRAQAMLIQVENNLASARESLRELIGEEVSSLDGLQETIPLLKPKPESEKAWVVTAIQHNLELLSSQLELEGLKQDIKVYRRVIYPKLDLIMSHNRYDTDTEEERIIVGSQQYDNNFTTEQIKLQLSMPLYTGGSYTAEKEQAKLNFQAAQYENERLKRKIERMTRDSYTGIYTELARIAALKQVVVSSEIALIATEASYDAGTRTSVDVLNARRNLFQARLDYAVSHYQYILKSLQLKYASGRLNISDLKAVNQWLEH